MIDGGPLRTSRPTGRQTAYRNEPAHYQPEEPRQEEPVMPVVPSRQVQQQHRQVESELPSAPARRAPNLSWVKWVVALLVVLLICVAGWMLWPSQKSIVSTIDTSKYQAVFLSNGQVYFGKMTVVNDDYMQLTSVFYLEKQLTAANDSDDEIEGQPATDANNFQLLKYSDVLYGSEDAMVISKDDIIRYENLRTDGVVAKAIASRR